MNIVQKTLKDMIPKMIMYQLFEKVVNDYLRSGRFTSDISAISDEDATKMVQPNDSILERINFLTQELDKLVRIQDVVLNTAELDSL